MRDGKCVTLSARCIAGAIGSAAMYLRCATFRTSCIVLLVPPAVPFVVSCTVCTIMFGRAPGDPSQLNPLPPVTFPILTRCFVPSLADVITSGLLDLRC